MSLRMTTPKSEIDAYIQQRINNLKKQIARTLGFVGEECRNEAIRRHRYINRTGNLESSTGYVVVMDGKVVQSGGFHGEQKHDENAAAEGLHYAKSIAARLNTTRACLVVVAGKHYAKYVADKGLDVLDSAELTAERLIPEMMETLVI